MESFCTLTVVIKAWVYGCMYVLVHVVTPSFAVIARQMATVLRRTATVLRQTAKFPADRPQGACMMGCGKSVGTCGALRGFLVCSGI